MRFFVDKNQEIKISGGARTAPRAEGRSADQTVGMEALDKAARAVAKNDSKSEGNDQFRPEDESSVSTPSPNNRLGHGC